VNPFKRSILWTAVFCWVGAAYGSQVRVQKSAAGWTLFVDSHPYLVHGICYGPTRIGEDPPAGNWQDWMIEDADRDGRIDAPYQAWIDANTNHRQNQNEPAVGDFKLMQDMGINTIRLYHHATTDPDVQAVNQRVPANVLRYNHPPNKALLRDLFKTYGIRVAMGDFLGAYTVGSGADWDKGTDYRDPAQQRAMLRSVEAMVRDFKDEPYLLFWVLGNENNLRPQTNTNANAFVKEYAEFVNRVAERIHRMDPHHPVCLCNGETQGLKTYAHYAPSVDIFGVNAYRRNGFGQLWNEVAETYDRPVILTEYGVLKPRLVNGDLDEAYQAYQHRTAWCDIARHAAGGEAPANALGGFAYEWVDQWWYDGLPSEHNEGKNGLNNEWHGLTSQGDGYDSPLQRQPRKAYTMYRQLWKTGDLTCPP
jgi:hypothetical protein